MRLIQLAFSEGGLPEELTWAMMVLLLKGEEGYWGIRLVEVSWKVCVVILNLRLNRGVDRHDSLHGFWKGRVTGTETPEANLAQKLDGLDH